MNALVADISFSEAEAAIARFSGETGRETPWRTHRYMSQDVYFAYFHDLRLVKIGMSSNVASRVKELERRYGASRVMLVIRDAPWGTERTIHLMMRGDNVRFRDSPQREWFLPTPGMLTLLSSMHGDVSGLPVRRAAKRKPAIARAPSEVAL